MFICEKCIEEKYNESFSIFGNSSGTCEICGKVTECMDDHGRLTLKGNQAVTATMRNIIEEQLKVIHKIMPDEDTDIIDIVDEYLIEIGRYTARVVRDEETGNVTWAIDVVDGDDEFKDIYEHEINSVSYAIETITGLIGKDMAQQHLRKVNETVSVLNNIHTTVLLNLGEVDSELQTYVVNHNDDITTEQKIIIEEIVKKLRTVTMLVDNELKNYRESIQ